jgi:hypothetical protein
MKIKIKIRIKIAIKVFITCKSCLRLCDSYMSAYVLNSCTPEDDPRKGSKHVALPPTANTTNFDTIVSICLFQNYCCVDCPIIYLSKCNCL